MKTHCIRNLPLSFIVFLFLITLSPAQNKEQKEIIEDAKKAKAAFVQQDPQMSRHFANAEAYVIFPNVGKGAYVVGGAAGNGVVYENGNLVGMAKLRQIDVGVQVGGQAYRQVLLFNSEAALNRFKEGNYEIAANASAVVLEEGVAKTLKFLDGVAIVTMPKAGAMVEISVGGQKFEFESFK